MAEVTLEAGWTHGEGNTAGHAKQYFDDPGYTYTWHNDQAELKLGESGADTWRAIAEFGPGQLGEIPKGSVVTALAFKVYATSASGNPAPRAKGTDGLGSIDRDPVPSNQTVFDKIDSGDDYCIPINWVSTGWKTFSLVQGDAVGVFQTALDACHADPAADTKFQVGLVSVPELAKYGTAAQTEANPCKLVVTFHYPVAPKAYHHRRMRA